MQGAQGGAAAARHDTPAHAPAPAPARPRARAHAEHHGAKLLRAHGTERLILCRLTHALTHSLTHMHSSRRAGLSTAGLKAELEQRLREARAAAPRGTAPSEHAGQTESMPRPSLAEDAGGTAAGGDSQLQAAAGTAARSSPAATNAVSATTAAAGGTGTGTGTAAAAPAATPAAPSSSSATASGGSLGAADGDGTTPSSGSGATGGSRAPAVAVAAMARPPPLAQCSSGSSQFPSASTLLQCSETPGAKCVCFDLSACGHVCAARAKKKHRAFFGRAFWR